MFSTLKLYIGRLYRSTHNYLVYGGQKLYWACRGAYIDWDKQFM